LTESEFDTDSGVGKLAQEQLLYVDSLGSAASALDGCRISPKSSMDQPQTSVGSALDDCRVCMHEKNGRGAAYIIKRIAG